MKRIAVIGGGLGGLSGAIHLARRNCRVQLFEANEQLGGKMAEVRLGGYRFDTGPSLMTMPFVLDDLHPQVRESMELVPLNPLCRYFFPDGRRLDACSDEEEMTAAIEAFAPGEGEAYRRFIRYSGAIYNRSAGLFLHNPIHEWRSILRPAILPSLLKIHEIDPFRNVDQGVRRFFSDPALVQLFNRYATYNGSDPFRAPATLNIIPYVEYTLGGFYIKNGMHQLVRTLTKIAQKCGVEINTSIEVNKIEIRNGRTTGIVADHDFHPADAVLSGADVVVTHDQLIPGCRRVKKRLNRLEPSLSGLVFLWGVKRSNPGLAHHNIIFSSDYRTEFRQIFSEGRIPGDPTIYIAITARADPHHAPAGGENWFVLINMPYLGSGWEKDFDINTMRQTVFTRLAEHGFDLSGQIEAESVLTPHDFLTRFRSNRGSIYGLSSNSRSSAFSRPANRSRQIRGLYFSGASTHPGGGVPLVLLSGKIAAQLISDYELGQRQ